MQLESFKILTVTHKRTHLKEIANYVIKADSSTQVKKRLEGLKLQFQLDELLYLSTCNRVMYLFVSDEEIDSVFAGHFFQHVNPELSYEAIRSIENVVDIRQGADAINHLFEVAASIDSLVIGERQILRQLREAFEQCQEWGLTGDHLRLAFHNAVTAAKKVYAQTRIGDKPISIVSLAIQKLLKANLPKEARILLIGAGQTNQLVAKFLIKHNFTNVTVFNRSLAKAQTLASKLEGDAYSIENLSSYTKGFDCLVVCTAATSAIINTTLYQHLLQGETDEKVLIDLAIPHNVDPEVLENFSVNYIEIDGLRHLAKENLAFREKEVSNAYHLLHAQLDEFPTQLKQRQLELAMRRVPVEIKAVKKKALNEVFQKEVETLDDSTRELVERMLSYMEKKCIGIPMKAARELTL